MPFPAGMYSDKLPRPLDLAKDIAMEDWDLLFDAVIARLQASFDDMPADNAAPRHVTWVQTRARVMDCVQALDQLHLAATHELARLGPAATAGQPLATTLQGGAAPADPPPLQDDVVRAIWQVWHENLCARAGLSPPPGQTRQPSR